MAAPPSERTEVPRRRQRPQRGPGPGTLQERGAAISPSTATHRGVGSGTASDQASIHTGEGVARTVLLSRDARLRRHACRAVSVTCREGEQAGGAQGCRPGGLMAGQQEELGEVTTVQLPCVFINMLNDYPFVKTHSSRQ